MKFKYLLPILGITLSSCQQIYVVKDGVFCFGSYTDITLYEGNKENVDDIIDILNKYSKLSDNYRLADVTNIKSINQTNDEIAVPDELFDLLKTSFNVMSEGAEYFNPLCGSLSELWKTALEDKILPSESDIQNEINKINNSSFSFDDDNKKVQRTGEALLDLGAIAKGYTVDVIREYLKEKNISKYLINAGKSSILLGEKATDNGYFTIELEEVRGHYLIGNEDLQYFQDKT